MADCIQAASMALTRLLADALQTLMAKGTLPRVTLPPFRVEIPADKTFGDFASNVAMVCAKSFRMPPRKIAQLLLDALDLEDTIFSRGEVAGLGFLNFFLRPTWFCDVVQTVLTEKENYGRTKAGAGARVNVEFVSANPTGPVHIGNARGGALGDSLAEILSWTGWNVTREFYINDAGNQIEKFATSLEARYLQHFDPSVPMPEDAYQGEDITEHAQHFIEAHGDTYVHTGEKTRRDALVAYALPRNIASLEKILKEYRIDYDVWFRESTLHENGQVRWVIEELTRRGCTYEKEGAVWFRAEQFGADKDFVLVRQNGIPTYVVPDIAYNYNKLMVRRYDKAIMVLGADHHGYVPRLKAALKALLGDDANRLDAVIMQMVLLLRDGEAVKFSKRSGKAITLETLLEDIPVDAARFFFNTREAGSHFEFDLDLAVEKSAQNPVYYVQYAHARICSLERTMAEEGLTLAQCDRDTLSLLTAPEEIELIRHLASLPTELNMAGKQYDPSRLTKYVLELATKFHKFYDVCSVKYASSVPLQQARLLLSEAARQVISNALGILKVNSPEKM